MVDDVAGRAAIVTWPYSLGLYQARAALGALRSQVMGVLARVGVGGNGGSHGGGVRLSARARDSPCHRRINRRARCRLQRLLRQAPRKWPIAPPITPTPPITPAPAPAPASASATKSAGAARPALPAVCPRSAVTHRPGFTRAPPRGPPGQPLRRQRLRELTIQCRLRRLHLLHRARHPPPAAAPAPAAASAADTNVHARSTTPHTPHPAVLQTAPGRVRPGGGSGAPLGASDGRRRRNGSRLAARDAEAQVGIEANFESGSSYCTFKRRNQRGSTQGQPRVNLHCPTISLKLASEPIARAPHALPRPPCS